MMWPPAATAPMIGRNAAAIVASAVIIFAIGAFLTVKGYGLDA